MKSMHLCLLAFLPGVLVLGCNSLATSGAGPIDWSSPETTVVSFTKAAARGQDDLAQSCFLPGGVDYEDIREVLTATPGSSAYEMKQMLQSINADVAMPILATEELLDGTKVIWQVTFRHRFETRKGVVLNPGTTYDFDAILKLSKGKWLIDNF
jgi:hypothetical protein